MLREEKIKCEKKIYIKYGKHGTFVKFLFDVQLKKENILYSWNSIILNEKKIIQKKYESPLILINVLYIKVWTHAENDSL